MSESLNSLWSGSCSSEDESQIFGSFETPSKGFFTERKFSSTSPDTHLDATKRPSYSFHAIIAMASQSSPQKRMRLQEIYEYVSTDFPYYSAKKSSRWQNSIRNYWEMNCDFGTDVYIGEKSGNLLRRENSKEQPSPPPPVPMDLSNIPLSPNPLIYNPATMTLQNQILIQVMIQNYQLQQSFQGRAAIGTLPLPPLFITELSKKEE